MAQLSYLVHICLIHRLNFPNRSQQKRGLLGLNKRKRNKAEWIVGFTSISNSEHIFFFQTVLLIKCTDVEKNTVYAWRKHCTTTWQFWNTILHFNVPTQVRRGMHSILCNQVTTNTDKKNTDSDAKAYRNHSKLHTRRHATESTEERDDSLKAQTEFYIASAVAFVPFRATVQDTSGRFMY